VAAQEKKFTALLNSLILAKCFRCKLWENSLYVSKQLEKIGRYSRQSVIVCNLFYISLLRELCYDDYRPVKENMFYGPK
jgi:ATP-dependent DNA helicase HFM1/MER3